MGGFVTIDRQRRRLLISSAAAALTGSAGLAMLSGAVARAAEQSGTQPPSVQQSGTQPPSVQQSGTQPPPAQPPSAPSAAPIFSPRPPWLGTFGPTTINLSSPPSAPADFPLPPGVRPREAWGAAPPVQPYVPQTPNGVSLHHTGAFWNGRPGPEQYLRNIQAFHTGPQREWEDIAYHYLVDLDGVVWAGRPPTVRGNPSIYYDPTGLVLISFLGDFDTQVPSEPQLAASADVAAWLMKKYSIPPTALSGHRDHAPTSCPGDNLYRPLQDGSFAKRVRDSLAKL